jgi:uncharacterized delta-60 repeat protein
MRNYRRAVPVVAACAVALAAAPAVGATYKPDSSFGSRGVVTTTMKGVSLNAYDAVAVSGGKVVVAGQSATGKGVTQVIVARYLKNGKLDRSFATKGIYKSTLPSKSGPYVARSVGVQPGTGKLVVAGGYGEGSILVMRLTSSGKLDKSFGPKRSGMVTSPVGDIGGPLAFGSDGSILVGSSNQNANGRPYVVAGFTASGSPDPSFGTGGQVQLIFWDPAGASSAGMTSLAVTADGKITGSGHLDYIGSGGHGSAGVFRLDSSGQLDPGFGTAGHVELARPDANGVLPFWCPAGMVIDSAGRITITGDGTGVASRSKGAVRTVRITASGQPDTSFGPGGDGWVVTDGVSDGTQPLAGAAATAGGGLAVGVGNWMLGLTSAGLADTQFGSSGSFRISRPKGVDIETLLTGSSGKTLLGAGSAGNALYLVRYRK